MTVEQKAGQLVMVSLNGGYLNDQIRSLIEQYHIGAVVFMGGNIKSQTQVLKFISDMNEISTTTLLIATDQEGGVVARIPWDQARLISQPHIGIIGRDDFAYEIGVQHAQALNQLGIDMNLSPVLDIAFSPTSSLANRSFGNNPESTAELGSAMIKAYQDNGLIACAKHYPGIGRTTGDTHNVLPTIDIQREQLFTEELIPFQSAIESNVEVIMTGHVLYPQIDADFPSSLSTVFVTDILRNELGFNGVILTDDIRMGALDNYPDKAVQAIQAGNDMIIIVDSYENQIEFINQIKEAIQNGTISEQAVSESIKRILRLKFKYL
jgi:beta-N-acetylhexosaminidase